MMTDSSQPLSLVSRWTIHQGCEAEARAALQTLAKAVRENEHDTLVYTVHLPSKARDPRLISVPVPCVNEVLFFEVYRNPDAFETHVNGSIFQSFLANHGALFVSASGSRSPFIQVEFLERIAGFDAREST